MQPVLTNQLNNAFTLFLSLLVEAIPFLLLGVLFSGLLLGFVDERKLVSRIPRNPLLAALMGSSIGFLFPVCECGNVPVARRLLMQGVPAPAAIGFLLAAPTINPVVIWATWTAFRDQPEIVVLRVVFSLLIATIIGWVFSAQTDLRPLLHPSVARAIPLPKPEFSETELAPADTPLLLQSGTFMLGQGGAVPIESLLQDQRQPLKTGKTDKTSKRSSMFHRVSKERLRLLLDTMVQELRELGGVLVVGSAIAAIIQVGAPRELILNLGQGPVSSILAMLLLAAVVSICSTVDAFFALSFASTFTSGSLLAFLVFGPMIDLKGIGLMLSIFKGRSVIYLMVLAAQLTFLMTLAVNLYLG
ncbi:MAG: permease [Microcoleus sp. PH2017_01_SCD_O_A]|uniref:permease n=1 Tax=unclassified Microcoleus TaxID=2642155 RepID=UPI001D4B9CAC|nr:MULTISPECIES: permease [unclassified Microcoleus]MCC3422584.1 permease [Microcoleus sp. PH2017_01_SCD_O_A]MCC3564162.1 permease [Microcoleus sp. PH2017_31_RDM_U_A]MCC3576672.1 permease [Microcoleus sp. PH2017_32_RDM_D_A]MCC3614564.1 permease [Microcoleus sp. PH2017_38_RDM_U_B]